MSIKIKIILWVTAIIGVLLILSFSEAGLFPSWVTVVEDWIVKVLLCIATAGVFILLMFKCIELLYFAFPNLFGSADRKKK